MQFIWIWGQEPSINHQKLIIKYGIYCPILNQIQTMKIAAIATATPDEILTHEEGELMQRRMFSRISTEPISDLFNILLKHVYRGEINERRHCVALKYHERLLGEINPNDKIPGTNTERRMEIYAKEALALTLDSIAKLPTNSTEQTPKFSHIIYVSCTGQIAPGISVGIVEHLCLASSTNILEINFYGGCAGLLTGLKVARDIIDSKSSSRVLLCATELCSLHFQPTKSNEQIIVNSIFGDGSVSMICEGEGNTEILQSKVSHAWRHIASKTYLLPDTKDMITWNLGSAGFKMSLSPALPKYISKNLKSVVEIILTKEGIALSDITNWAIHPGGPKILETCQSALSLSDEQVATSWQIYRDFGNMSSSTVGFILEKMRAEKRHGYCVAIAFAPGVRVEVAILHY